jgi:hypothetical protein
VQRLASRERKLSREYVSARNARKERDLSFWRMSHIDKYDEKGLKNRMTMESHTKEVDDEIAQ